MNDIYSAVLLYNEVKDEVIKDGKYCNTVCSFATDDFTCRLFVKADFVIVFNGFYKNLRWKQKNYCIA